MYSVYHEHIIRDENGIVDAAHLIVEGLWPDANERRQDFPNLPPCPLIVIERNVPMQGVVRDYLAMPQAKSKSHLQRMAIARFDQERAVFEANYPERNL